ncbi:MAG: hypothetical protein H6673_15605 [Anaerolineales bacterium]|nr:hypothetical protein [Anaerolineales bacterium]
MSSSQEIFHEDIPFLSPGGFPARSIEEVIAEEYKIGFDCICVSLHEFGQYGFSKELFNVIDGLVQSQNYLGSLEIRDRLSLASQVVCNEFQAFLKHAVNLRDLYQMKPRQILLKIAVPGPALLFRSIQPYEYGPYYEYESYSMVLNILSDIVQILSSVITLIADTGIDGIQIDEMLDEQVLESFLSNNQKASYNQHLQNLTEHIAGYRQAGKLKFVEFRVSSVINTDTFEFLRGCLERWYNRAKTDERT